MASISRDANGTKRVCFTDGDSERKSVRRDGPVKAAEAFRLRIEDLLSNKTLGRSHDAELSAWLRDLPRTDARSACPRRAGGTPCPHGGGYAGEPAEPFRRDGDGEARDGGSHRQATGSLANTWAKIPRCFRSRRPTPITGGRRLRKLDWPRRRLPSGFTSPRRYSAKR